MSSQEIADNVRKWQGGWEAADEIEILSSEVSKYREALEKKGLVIAGMNPERDLVEIVEIKKHPFFVGTQFHPELKSRPLRPHPLYREFIKAAIRNRRS